MRPKITQGTNRTLWARGIVDANGAPLTVTGWSVRGVARADTTAGDVLSEWSTTPTGPQGVATASGREVSLRITPAQSSSWNCPRVVIQAEITSPAGLVERIIDQILDVDREAVV